MPRSCRCVKHEVAIADEVEVREVRFSGEALHSTPGLGIGVPKSSCMALSGSSGYGGRPAVDTRISLSIFVTYLARQAPGQMSSGWSMRQTCDG